MAFKRISEYDEQELHFAIEHAKDHCEQKGLDFYIILKGIDAYMERRNRKLLKEAQSKGAGPQKTMEDPLGR